MNITDEEMQYRKCVVADMKMILKTMDRLAMICVLAVVIASIAFIVAVLK